MPARVVTILKDWKEIIVLIAAVSGLYIASPTRNEVPRDMALARLTIAVDSLNGRVTVLTWQINALIRIQCAQSEARALNLAGVSCNH